MEMEGKALLQEVGLRTKGAKFPQTNCRAPFFPRAPVLSTGPVPPVPALVLWNEQRWAR